MVYASLYLYLSFMVCLCNFFHIPSFILPTPTAVANEMVFQLTQMDFYKNLLYTLSRFCWLDFTLSFVWYYSRLLYWEASTYQTAGMPLLVFFQVSRKIALISYFHYLVWTWLWLQIIHRFHHVLFSWHHEKVCCWVSVISQRNVCIYAGIEERKIADRYLLS